MKRLLLSVSIAALALPGTLIAQDVPAVAPSATTNYSPYPAQDFPNQVLFGDTHLHTSFSADAGMLGNTVGPDEAYRYAKGETVISSTGIPTRLARPLDFLVISDHAENLGLAPALAANDPVLMATEWGRELAEIIAPGTLEAIGAGFGFWTAGIFSGVDPLEGTNFAASMWLQSTAAAERHNNPGAFTALIGFEWTSLPGGSNLHRNVIFRDNKNLADTIVPFSAYDSQDPERLWDWMEAYESSTGGSMLAIAHNGNLSNGLMFDDVTFTDRRALDRDYAERRIRWEPLYEVTQMKGDGEAHPFLSPNDEFADFETWDTGSFGPDAKTPDMLPKEYAREALKTGLAYEESLGVNPFKFGLIGSTDAHTSLATTTEDNFFGKIVVTEPTADPVRFEEVIIGRESSDPDVWIHHWQASGSGLAAVWARENTREAIFDAMARKEVFATTGTRIRVRVFGGWDYTETDLTRSNFAEYGYDNGVPMGGDLRAAATGDAPNFLIQTVRDPDGANLDRIQIIKGWLDDSGETQERIYDLACSDDRDIRSRRCDGLVGNTVNVEEASYANSIGEPYLQAHWTDPDFDADQRAFYYVRVLEIPTPRWTTFDAKIFGVEIPEEAPTSIQERAYTSPIWYTP